MDLRPRIRNMAQIEKAKQLVLSLLFGYQPFIFADDLEVGVGHELICGEFGGLIYCPTVPANPDFPPQLKNFLVKKEGKEKFSRANARLRVMYDNFVRVICDRVGDVLNTTFADIGCNSGYFPVSFSLRGAKKAVGYDVGRYGKSVQLLNEILGTDAEFVNQGYDASARCVPGCGPYDVVVSMFVLVHMCDPFFYLKFLGSIARKALFIWTPVTEDDFYCVRFGEPNKYYRDQEFPFGFDNEVRPSPKLLQRSLELMGFREICEIPQPKDGMPDKIRLDGISSPHKALLALR